MTPIRLPLIVLLLLAACSPDTIDDARAADDLGRDRPTKSILKDGSPETAAGKAEVNDVVAASFAADESYAPPSMGAAGSSAAYMRLENRGSHPIVVHRVVTPAGTASLHGHEMDADGTMRMPALDSLTIPPHGEVWLKPGGTHIMLTDLARPLKVGDAFPLTFEYNNGAVMTAQVFVISPEEVRAMRGTGEKLRPLDNLHH